MSDTESVKKYAQLILRVGLNLEAGQRLLIGAPIQAASLVRSVTEEAYKSGCRLVLVRWDDDATTLARYKYAPDDSFEEFPVWEAEGLYQEAKNGAASLFILGFDPDLLSSQDPERVSTALRTRQKHLRPLSELRRRNAMNWCVASMPVPSWAAKVFPQDSPEDQMRKLTDVIFSLCRLDTDDPESAWNEHIRRLCAKRDFLNGKRYRALEYSGGGTELRIGLPARHRWISAQVESERGITFVPNLPTEEVFTLPHRDEVEGTVVASKPLYHRGMVFENFSLTFEKGKVVDIKADRGEDLLKKIVETDEGANRLGEVALVPESSPVAQSGLLFYNPLLDENAACHFALGFGFQENLEGGMNLSAEDFAKAGGNTSQVHMDFMVGSKELSVDGVTEAGKREAVLKKGEWAI